METNHFTWWKSRRRFVDHWNEIFQFSLQHFNGVVCVRVLKQVTHQITNHHLVVRFGAGFGGVVGAIHDQDEKNCKEINLDRQAHFENSVKGFQLLNKD